MVHITKSCWGVALGCPGPLTYGKCGSDEVCACPVGGWQASRVSRSNSYFHASLSDSVAGAGKVVALGLCPRRVSIWNRIHNYKFKKINMLRYVNCVPEKDVRLTADRPPRVFFLGGELVFVSVSVLTTCDRTLSSWQTSSSLWLVSASECFNWSVGLIQKNLVPKKNSIGGMD